MYYLHMFYIHAHTPVYLQNAAKISKITSNLPRLLKKKKIYPPEIERNDEENGNDRSEDRSNERPRLVFTRIRPYRNPTWCNARASIHQNKL